MRRVDIVAPRRRALALLRALHRSGLVHLVHFAPPPGTSEAVFGPYVFPSGPATGPLGTSLERVAELRKVLGGDRAAAALVAELWELDDAALGSRIERLEPIRSRATALAAEHVRLEGEADRLEGFRQLIDGLEGIVDRIPSIRGYVSTAVVVQARYRPLIGVLREELEDLTGGHCGLIVADLARERVAAALLYPQRLSEQVRTLLGGRDLEEVTLP